jgi:hypothetical protein
MHFSGQAFAPFLHPRITPLRLPKWCAVPHDDLELRADLAELARLLEKQIEVFELATFVSLTDAELSEYATREKRISELLER